MLRGERIGLRRGAKTVLRGVDLGLHGGEIVVVLGPNGAGKSSLLRVLAGELVPSEGQCLLDGRPLQQYRPDALAARRAVLDVGAAPLFPVSVRDLVAMGRLPLAPALVSGQLQRMLDAYGLQALADRDARSLSAGELQRANLARVHLQIGARLDAGEYACLLLDEPAAHLDPAWLRELVLALRELKSRGAALLLVVHDIDLAMAIADRVLLLRSGEVLACGPPDRVLTVPALQALYGIPFSEPRLSARQAPAPCMLDEQSSAG